MLAKETPAHRGDLEGFNWFKEVWNIKCGPKIKFFLWSAMVGALPLGELSENPQNYLYISLPSL